MRTIQNAHPGMAIQLETDGANWNFEHNFGEAVFDTYHAGFDEHSGLPNVHVSRDREDRWSQFSTSFKNAVMKKVPISASHANSYTRRTEH